MQRFISVVVLSMLLLLATACSASTAHITKAELARGYKDGQAVDATATFQPSDTPIHAVITLGNAPDDTKIKVVWTIVDIGDDAYKNKQLDSTELKTSGVGDFTLSNTKAWPAGRYKAEVYLNDKLDRTLEFTVAS